MKRVILAVLYMLLVASALYAQPAQIWKTGQTESYRTGDDGDYEKGVSWPSLRFSDQSNGEVTDNLTGLVWTKDANAPGPSACGPAVTKTWQGALDYVKCLNTQNYLGHSDWRLPNRKELFSLVDRKNYGPALPSGHPFTNVQSSRYWSSTTHAYGTDSAWDVVMWYGYVSYYYKGFGYYVWPVRSGQVGPLIISPVIAMTPMSGPPGQVFKEWGTGFTPNGTATLRFKKPDGYMYPDRIELLDSIGHFDITYEAPYNKPPGTYLWWAIDNTTKKLSNVVSYEIVTGVSFRDRSNLSSAVSGAVADGAAEVAIQIAGLPAGTTVGDIIISLHDGDGSLTSERSLSDGVFRQIYRAPFLFASDGKLESYKQEKREIPITITVNGVNFPHDPFYLVRPPLVLLHGIWSDPGTWSIFMKKLKKDYGYTDKYIVAWRYTNDVFFDDNKQVVNDAINQAIQNARLDKYAVKKVDVVGHSMGGLLARLYGSSSTIRSLTTIGTPHFGSSLADKIYPWVDDQDNPVDKFIARNLEKRDMSATRGAVKDLRVSGGEHCAVQNCKKDDLPTRAIVGISSPSQICDSLALDLVLYTCKFINICPWGWGWSDLNSYLFGSERNDWIVSESSQAGHWTGDTDAVPCHTQETSDEEVFQKVMAFLSGTSSSSAQKKAVAGPAVAKRALTSPRPLPLSSGSIAITSPTSDQTFKPGQTVSVNVDVSTENSIVMITSSSGASVLLDHGPYQFSFVIPPETLGPMTIAAGAQDKIGFIGSDEVTVTVTSSATLTDIIIYPEGNPLYLPIGSGVQVSVQGVYDDGLTRKITSGTTYTSNKPDIVSVTPEGVITAHASSGAILSIENGGVKKEITIIGTLEERSLSSPWNLISLPLQPIDTGITTALKSIEGNYSIVWAYSGQAWKLYDPSDPEGSTLKTIDAGMGYWIKTISPGSLSITGTTPPSSVSLLAGWNLAGYNKIVQSPASDVLSSIAGKYTVVWAYIDGVWKLYDPSDVPGSTLKTFEPGYGYWIKTTQAVTWSQ